jgi:hypothetical protein
VRGATVLKLDVMVTGRLSSPTASALNVYALP